MTDELKPCPFCKSQQIKNIIDQFLREFAECINCGAKTPLEAWNTRHDEMTDDMKKITRQQLRSAMALDFQQWLINGLTPERDYDIPTDNTWELIKNTYHNNNDE